MRSARRRIATLVLGMIAIATSPGLAQGAVHDTVSTTVNPLIPRLSDIPGAADPTFVANLRKGGYVIFFRHASTDWTQNDLAGENFENRAAQRNLSEAGKAEAASIGSAWKTLAIPIDSVFASPMLRCRDTAEIAFGRCLPMIDLFRKGPEYREKRLKILGTAPTPGTNRVLVGHQDQIVPIVPGLHRDELREGEALVIEPRPDRTFRVVAHVTLADWARLAAAHPGPKGAGDQKSQGTTKPPK